jgi:hypothetical protein
VHCEQQVLRFVMSYLSTTAVEPHDAAAIWGEVSNSCKPNTVTTACTNLARVLVAAAAAAAVAVAPWSRSLHSCDSDNFRRFAVARAHRCHCAASPAT